MSLSSLFSLFSLAWNSIKKIIIYFLLMFIFETLDGCTNKSTLTNCLLKANEKLNN